MIEEEKEEEDSIHLRAVKYGYQRPNGFSYNDIQHHYSKRLVEWEVVRVFLYDARENKGAGGRNIPTPFLLLKTTGIPVDTTTYTLSYEAYFIYLDYLELVMARKNARSAFWMAIIAIGISIAGMRISIYFSQKQIESPVKVDAEQYQKIIETIDDRQR